MIHSRLFFCLLILALSCSSATAQKIEYVFDLTDKVSAKTHVTYIELLKKIFPDIRLHEEAKSIAIAQTSIPIRHLFGEYKDKTYEDMVVNVSSAMETTKGNEKILWLIVDAIEKKKENCGNCGVRLLTAFRIKKDNTELIDVADVKTEDQVIFADERRTLELSPRIQSVIICDYTQLAYGEEKYSIISANQNGFNVVLKQFTLQKGWFCGSALQEIIKFKELKTTVGNFRSFEIRVTTEAGFDIEDENPKPEWRRKFRYVFSWQSKTEQYKAIVNPVKQHEAAYKKYKPCKDMIDENAR